jgi:hypothetical protein
VSIRTLLPILGIFGVVLVSACDKSTSLTGGERERMPRSSDPTDDQALFQRAADIIRHHRPAPDSVSTLYTGTFRTARGLAPLLSRCAREVGWTPFLETLEEPADNSVVDTALGIFVVGGSKLRPFARHRFAVRVSDGSCAYLNRDDQMPEFSWTGDRAAAAVLLAFDAFEFPAITGTATDAIADSPTSRAMGVLAAYASPALAKPLSGPTEEGHAPPTEPAASAHQFGTFEYAGGGLKLGLEARPRGVGLFVVNATRSAISINPSDIVITTTDGKFSPTTLHPVQLALYGSATRSFSIKSGAREGIILSGFCSLNGCTENPLGANAAGAPTGLITGVEVAGHPLLFTGG